VRVTVTFGSTVGNIGQVITRPSATPSSESVPGTNSNSGAIWAEILTCDRAVVVPWLVTRIVYLVVSPTWIGSVSSAISSNTPDTPLQVVESWAESLGPSAVITEAVSVNLPGVLESTLTINIFFSPGCNSPTFHVAVLPSTVAPSAVAMTVSGAAVSVTTTPVKRVSPVLETSTL